MMNSNIMRGFGSSGGGGGGGGGMGGFGFNSSSISTSYINGRKIVKKVLVSTKILKTNISKYSI